MTVRDLLTMNCGHDTDPTGTVRKKRQRPVAGKPARHQYRRLGVVPQNGRPCQDGTTVPAERKLERTADSARRMGKGGICLPSALTARRHETGDAEERATRCGAAATTPTVPMVPTDNTYWCCRTRMPSLPSPPTSPTCRQS